MGQGAESAGGYELDYNPNYENQVDGFWTQRDHSLIQALAKCQIHT